MLHRTFIAINLPEEIKKELISWQKKWPNLPGHWTKPKNLHITLLFLGNLDNEQLKETLQKAQEIGARHNPFLISLNKICFGPPQKIPPKMVWAEGESSDELTSLHSDLENTIFGLPSYKYKEREFRQYRLHITLARIKTWQFRRMEEKLEINESIDLSFEASSIEVMESQLKRGGAEYTILESVPLSR